MVSLFSASPTDTLALGRQWGETACPGWVIALSGDLGTGKTQLVKGLALGLGVTSRVHSPTFAIVHEHPGGRLPLIHLDLYRLETAAQLRSAGLEDYLFSPLGVTVVEWFDRWPAAGLPAPSGPMRAVTLETAGPSSRWIRYEDLGA